MLALCGYALFAIGIDRVRTCKDDFTALTGFYAIIVGFVVAVVGHIV